MKKNSIKYYTEHVEYPVGNLEKYTSVCLNKKPKSVQLRECKNIKRGS